MGARLHGTLSLILDSPAPENNLPLVVDSLQLEPDIESVNRAAGKEVADRSGSRDDVNTYRVTTPDYRRGSVDWSDDLRWWGTEGTS